ncbi:unnamed protein product [Plutella xylostella]|uniref:(diamondback moth) hypothetical protein n=1 Tax=Plutella xylostella TaxID=51655 RepID=A0A8S4G3G2_PLUXY|nr:unnamed protein product [Plutella xylostella]
MWGSVNFLEVLIGLVQLRQQLAYVYYAHLLLLTATYLVAGAWEPVSSLHLCVVSCLCFRVVGGCVSLIICEEMVNKGLTAVAWSPPDSVFGTGRAPPPALGPLAAHFTPLATRFTPVPCACQTKNVDSGFFFPNFGRDVVV